MEGLIMIQSNAITLNEGKILMNPNRDGSFSVPGKAVFENEDPEKVCLDRLQFDMKIIKPLSPKISWQKIGNFNIPIISLNYLTEIKNV